MSYIRGEDNLERPCDKYTRREPVEYKYIKRQEEQQDELYIGRHEYTPDSEDNKGEESKSGRTR